MESFFIKQQKKNSRLNEDLLNSEMPFSLQAMSYLLAHVWEFYQSQVLI